MKRVLAIALAVSLAAAACGDDEATATSAAQTGTSEAGTAPAESQTPSSKALTGTSHVTLRTDDGLDLEATVYPGGPQWVILGHMLPADKESWKALAAALQDRGFSVLAYNNRGYGGSEGNREPFSLLVDAAAAFDYAIGNGATAIVYGGASMNGAAAIALAASEDLAGVFTLSAVASFPSVPDTHGALGGIAEPALFVAARDDGNAVATAESFAAGVTSGEALILDEGGHGTRMLEADPTLIETIADWVAAQAVGD